MARLHPNAMTLLTFVIGMFAAFLLMALLPVTFQPVATSQSQERRVAINSGTYQILLHGFYPTICRVAVDKESALAGGNVTNLGQLNEFCTSRSGYIVYVDHTPYLSGAVLRVDGRDVVLAANGSTAILRSSQPASKRHSLALDLSKLPNAKGSLWFRIVPI